MADAALHDPPMTIEAFDAFMATVPDGVFYELVGGYAVMMANPTETHEQIVANIAAPLKLAMNARGCRTYIGGMRVQAADATKGRDAYRPDILVRCGPRADRTFVTDPTVIVEVLSPSTMEFDRREKLDFYKTLASVEHVALVYCDQLRVEHHVRTADGFGMVPLTLPDDALELSAVGFAMPLEAVYFDVDFTLVERPRLTRLKRP